MIPPGLQISHPVSEERARGKQPRASAPPPGIVTEAGPNRVNRRATGNAAEGRGNDSQVLAWIVEYCRRRDSLAATDLQAAATLGELKARIAHAHTALVESVARRFLGSGEPLEDLVQEGFLGLLSALENYNPTHVVAINGGSGRGGVKFSTYATHFVAGAIRHFLRDRGKIIKEPAWLHEVSVRISRTTDVLTHKLGRAPEPGEIAKELNLTEEAVREILSTRQTFQVAAFHASPDDDEGGALGLVDPEKIRSDRYVTLQLPIEDRIALESAVAKLKDLEQRVLLEFFYQDLSQTEIARKMGISCNYVSHIIKNSTGKLRRMIGEAEVRDRHRARENPITDPVTGFFHEEHALRRCDEELSRAARAAQPTAFLLVDIEGLPQGGLRREHVWGEIGEAVRRTVRRIDVIGRCDQNRIVLLLPNTREEHAQAVAVRLEDVLVATAGAVGEPLVIRVAVALCPSQGRSVPALLAFARSVLSRSTAEPLAPPTESLAA